MDILRLLFSRRWWWTTLIIILGIGLAIRLGFWQLDRHAKRQACIQQVLAMQSMPVLDLNSDSQPADLLSMEYRSVTATGVYDFENQVTLRNQVRARMSGTDPGYALVTPLLLPDGRAVMVERGWIPLDHSTPSSWRQFDESGTVTITGMIRLSMEQAEIGNALLDPTLSPGASRLDFWNFINLTRLQSQIPYPILDIYIQQAPGTDLESLPYRLMEQPDLEPGDHMGFALQWFFYAGLLLIGYPIWLTRQKKPPVS